jgi:farnesyl-diphosphate farnesyltransferase
VADTPLLPRAARLARLETLRAAFERPGVDVRPVALAFHERHAGDAEGELLGRLPEALALLDRLESSDQRAVRTVLATLTTGMVVDLTRFPGDDVGRLVALGTLADLDRYIYLVAGCVGEFWTTIHAAHRRRLAGWDVARMCEDGVRFGKALQLTNVLRDIPRDLRDGRCYVPETELAAHGLTPQDLVDPSAMAKFRPVFDALRALAEGHYAVAWRYTLAIPRAEWRMRLACAWPLMIGEATLATLARHPNPLAATAPLKISRGQVRTIVSRSAVAVWSNRALAAEAARWRLIDAPGARD